MNRRKFLTTTVVGAVATSLPKAVLPFVQTDPTPPKDQFNVGDILIVVAPNKFVKLSARYTEGSNT